MPCRGVPDPPACVMKNKSRVLRHRSSQGAPVSVCSGQAGPLWVLPLPNLLPGKTAVSSVPLFSHLPGLMNCRSLPCPLFFGLGQQLGPLQPGGAHLNATVARLGQGQICSVHRGTWRFLCQQGADKRFRHVPTLPIVTETLSALAWLCGMQQLPKHKHTCVS